MWIHRRNEIGVTGKFFQLVLSDHSLEGTLRINFALMQYHNYSLSDIEGLIPWERDLYVSMVIEHVEKENEKIYDQNGKMIGKINPIHYRPTEVDILLGDSTKAKKVLKWKPEYSFEHLVRIMTVSDHDKVVQGIKLQ